MIATARGAFSTSIVATTELLAVLITDTNPNRGAVDILLVLRAEEKLIVAGEGDPQPFRYTGASLSFLSGLVRALPLSVGIRPDVVYRLVPIAGLDHVLSLRRSRTGHLPRFR